MALTLPHPMHRPARRDARRSGVVRATRVALQCVALVLVTGLVMALAMVARPASGPPSGVRAPIEAVGYAPQLGVALAPGAHTDSPSVAIIDAICITNTPTQTPC